jgi:hypothetical protein
MLPSDWGATTAPHPKRHFWTTEKAPTNGLVEAKESFSHKV